MSSEQELAAIYAGYQRSSTNSLTESPSDMSSQTISQRLSNASSACSDSLQISSPSSAQSETRNQVLNELNLMLGQAIESAHSAFQQLVDSPPQLTPLQHVPQSNSYSSLLSSVRKEIHQNKLHLWSSQQQQQQDPHHSPPILPQDLSPNHNFLNSPSPTHPTPKSPCSSISNYSQDKLDDEDEKADRLTPLPASASVSPEFFEFDTEPAATSTLATSASQHSLTTSEEPKPTSSPPQSLSSPKPIKTYPQIVSSSNNNNNNNITTPTKSSSTKLSNPPLTPTKSSFHPINHHSPFTPFITVHSSPLKSSSISKSQLTSSPMFPRSDSAYSHLQNWQWLDAQSAFGTPKPLTSEPLATLTRKLRILDSHFSSPAHADELSLKHSLLLTKLGSLAETIRKRSSFKPSLMLNRTSFQSTLLSTTTPLPIDVKDLKKIKSTVERCKIYSSKIHELSSHNTGLDLWIWYQTLYSPLSSSSLNKENITHQGPTPPPLPPPHPIQRLDCSSPTSPPHVSSQVQPLQALHPREVSTSTSSILSFPARSDATKAIEIHERTGLVEIVNGSFVPGTQNPLMTVQSLPFPGLYKPGLLPTAPPPPEIPDFSRFSFGGATGPPLFSRRKPNQLPAAPLIHSRSQPPSTSTSSSLRLRQSSSTTVTTSSSRNQSQSSSSSHRTSGPGHFFSNLTRRNSSRRPTTQLHSSPMKKNPSISSPISAARWPAAGLSLINPRAAVPNAPKGPRPLESTNPTTESSGRQAFRSLGTGSQTLAESLGPSMLKKMTFSGSTPPSETVDRPAFQPGIQDTLTNSSTLATKPKEFRHRLQRHRSSFAYGSSANDSSSSSTTTTKPSLDIYQQSKPQQVMATHNTIKKGSGKGSEWEKKVEKLLDILPTADRGVLEEFLEKEGGDDVAAIGSYLLARQSKEGVGRGVEVGGRSY